MSFKLIVITPPQSVKNESEELVGLFKAGLQILHIRKPSFSKVELRNYLLKIPSKYHPKLVIHSHYPLLKEFKLKGIHLTEKTRKKKLPLNFKRKEHSLSASFHSITDVKRSKRKFDYVFLSPVFDSISKKGYRSKFSEEQLKKLLKEFKNVIALGGTDPATLRSLQKLNFSGAATLGSIWESKDAVKAYKNLRSKIK